MKTILYLPIDERFATRDTFLHLAKLTPYRVLTPPKELLPHKKQPTDLNTLQEWVDSKVCEADILILSAEMFLYGGLITSRISNDQLEIVEQGLARIKGYKEQYPNLQIYLSTVIMRIPAYNLDVEEPDFWQWHGKAIFDYSFHTHRYEVLGEEQDLQLADQIKATIPDPYLSEFIWRRERNHQITCQILNIQKEYHLFESIYITLDDNAPFGFNKREETILRQLVRELALEESVNIYPGADEVGLTILARLAVTETQTQPTFQVIWRDEEQKNLIPNYEGQELARSVEAQILGAGGRLATEQGDLFLCVNNFSTEKQLEARVQPENEFSDYALFEPYITSDQIIGFADVRYSNGGDRSFVNWIMQQPVELTHYAYAGWNTNGNTLGTVIANAILLHLFGNQMANQHFNTLRLLEDVTYQANLRTDLMNYVGKTAESIFDLSADLPFYLRFIEKPMHKALADFAQRYQLPYHLDQVFFPWERTFEIGLSLRER